jgi:hypothetical protein
LVLARLSVLFNDAVSGQACVVLVADKWLREWSIGVMILTGEKPFSPPEILQGMAGDWARFSVVAGRRLAVWAWTFLTLPLLFISCSHAKRCSVTCSLYR